MSHHANEPGINSASILDSSRKYSAHVKEMVESGKMRPLKEGILIWDETKV